MIMNVCGVLSSAENPISELGKGPQVICGMTRFSTRSQMTEQFFGIAPQRICE